MLLDENALAAGVAALLDARREEELGAIVRRSIVQVVGQAERWSMGAHDVAAFRIALVVSAADHVLLSSAPAKMTAVREAFAAAVRSPETELQNLSLVLELPPSRTTFAQGYRDAPRPTNETPAADAVLEGAGALLQAMGHDALAQSLSRATLEDSFGTTNERSVRRFVLRLDAADFARTERDVAFGDRLMRAVRSAAATATEMTTSVQLGLRLDDLDLPAGPEKWFVRAMNQKNATVVPIVRNDEVTSFAVVYREELFVVDLQQKKVGSATWFKRSSAIQWESNTLRTAIVPAQSITSADAAETLITEILRRVSAG